MEWTLEQVEQMFIEGAGPDMQPLDFYLTWCSPNRRRDLPAIPMSMYRQAWRNVIEREDIQVSVAGYVTRKPDAEPMDPNIKAQLLAFTFTGNGWPKD